MEKNNDKIHLEKRTLERKLKSLKEKKTGQKGNVTFSSRKENVKIISEKENKSHPKLSKEQFVEQEKCDAVFDELHALNAKIIAEEVEQKNAKPILTDMKPMFPDWTLERI